MTWVSPFADGDKLVEVFAGSVDGPVFSQSMGLGDSFPVDLSSSPFGGITDCAVAVDANGVVSLTAGDASGVTINTTVTGGTLAFEVDVRVGNSFGGGAQIADVSTDAFTGGGTEGGGYTTAFAPGGMYAASGYAAWTPKPMSAAYTVGGTATPNPLALGYGTAAEFGAYVGGNAVSTNHQGGL